MPLPFDEQKKTSDLTIDLGNDLPKVKEEKQCREDSDIDIQISSILGRKEAANIHHAALAADVPLPSPTVDKPIVVKGHRRRDGTFVRPFLRAKQSIGSQQKSGKAKPTKEVKVTTPTTTPPVFLLPKTMTTQTSVQPIGPVFVNTAHHHSIPNQYFLYSWDGIPGAAQPMQNYSGTYRAPPPALGAPPKLTPTTVEEKELEGLLRKTW